MKRDLARLSRNTYDVLVVGGGIHGAFAAWDAALRGLAVALVDKGDFGSATSSHSQKIIHGGLRYLQHGDLSRMRQSIRERTVLMRIAPHLVRPLPVLVPTYGYGLRGPEAMSLGLLVYNLFGLDRNRGLDSARRLPRGRTVSKEECRRLFPEVNTKGLRGGAIWYDGQVHNTERLVLSVLHSASSAGADLANYVEVTGFLREARRITGVTARDTLLGGKSFEIRARMVVNTGGPWLERICCLAGAPPPEPRLLSRAMVLVVRRPLVRDYAVGLPGKQTFQDPDVLLQREERFFFITPWRGHSLVGSAHLPFSGDPDEYGVSEAEIQDLLAAVNAACPAWAIRRDEVSFVYRGLLPTTGVDHKTGSIQVEKQYRILDHKRYGGIEGLISVMGVKYTTARDVAGKAIDITCRKLGKQLPGGRTATTPIHGGRIGNFTTFLADETARRPHGLEPEVMRHLVFTHGSEYPSVLRYLEKDPAYGERINSSSPVLMAEALYGIREEMAQKLLDIVLRRTELGSAGNPGKAALERCCALMARELGWDDARSRVELEEAERAFNF